MQRIMKAAILLVAITACAAPTTPARAQQAKETLPAPMPSQIMNAKKVFLSNAGGDSHGLYSGEPRRLYDQFYAALRKLGTIRTRGQSRGSGPGVRGKPAPRRWQLPTVRNDLPLPSVISNPYGFLQRHLGSASLRAFVFPKNLLLLHHNFIIQGAVG
jgi:hypothetical protein